MRAPDSLETPADVDALATELYGEPLGPAEGVLHVMAVASEGDRHRVIKIGPDAPESELDLFALNLARARVEAILATGSVLRAEPALRYDLGAAPDALSAWRGRYFDAPPLVLILSRGELPAAHPVWDSWARPVVYVPASATARLEATLPARVEVVAAREGGGRGALGYLRDRGCRAISVEAGPSVAVPLYDDPMVIDELMLSVYGGDLEPAARGGAFLDRTRLEGLLEPLGARDVGAWRFSRWRARPGTPGGSR